MFDEKMVKYAEEFYKVPPEIKKNPESRNKALEAWVKMVLELDRRRTTEEDTKRINKTCREHYTKGTKKAEEILAQKGKEDENG